jgi:flagellar biosynthesis component FlhA
VICDARIRPGIKGLLRRSLNQLAVIAYDEVVPGTQIEPVDTIALPESIAADEGAMQPLTV